MQGNLTAEKMKDCWWVKPVLVGVRLPKQTINALSKTRYFGIADCRQKIFSFNIELVYL